MDDAINLLLLEEFTQIGSTRPGGIDPETGVNEFSGQVADRYRTGGFQVVRSQAGVNAAAARGVRKDWAWFPWGFTPIPPSLPLCTVTDGRREADPAIDMLIRSYASDYIMPLRGMGMNVGTYFGCPATDPQLARGQGKSIQELVELALANLQPAITTQIALDHCSGLDERWPKFLDLITDVTGMRPVLEGWPRRSCPHLRKFPCMIMYNSIRSAGVGDNMTLDDIQAAGFPEVRFLIRGPGDLVDGWPLEVTILKLQARGFKVVLPTSHLFD